MPHANGGMRNYNLYWHFARYADNIEEIARK